MLKDIKINKTLKENWKEFLKHVRYLLKVVDEAASIYKRPISKDSSAKNSSNGKQASSLKNSDIKSKQTDKKELPLCLFDECSKKGLRHYLKDCRKCPDDEKKDLIAKYKKQKREESSKRVRFPEGADTAEKEQKLAVRKIAEVIDDEDDCEVRFNAVFEIVQRR